MGIGKEGKGVREGSMEGREGVGISATLAYPLPPLDLRVLAATCPNFQNFLYVCTSGFVDDFMFSKRRKYRCRPLANYSPSLAGREICFRRLLCCLVPSC